MELISFLYIRILLTLNMIFLFSSQDFIWSDQPKNTPCSIFAMICNIQEECKVPFAFAIATLRVLMLVIPRVYFIKERVIPKVLVPVSLD